MAFGMKCVAENTTPLPTQDEQETCAEMHKRLLDEQMMLVHFDSRESLEVLPFPPLESYDLIVGVTTAGKPTLASLSSSEC